MEDFKTRLVKEQSELEEKLNKLDTFLLSEKSNEIDDVQKDLLHIQAIVMNAYNMCLRLRLERLQK